MKIIIKIRRGYHPSDATISTDLQTEKDDTPRVHNLGLDIKKMFDKMTEEVIKEAQEEAEKKRRIAAENLKSKGVNS